MTLQKEMSRSTWKSEIYSLKIQDPRGHDLVKAATAFAQEHVNVGIEDASARSIWPRSKSEYERPPRSHQHKGDCSPLQWQLRSVVKHESFPA